MNFLAHYYFEGKKDDPYFNLGLVLPDLMGMVRRGWKVGKQNLKPFADGDHQSLAKGIHHHLTMDEWFHETAFFYQGQAHVKAALQKAGVAYPPYRLSFLSHIGLELMMDRLLVKHYPEQIRRFYAELSTIRLSQLKRFYLKSGLPFEAGFPRFFKGFLEKQYAFQYAQPDAFIRAIDHISARVRQPALTHGHHQALAQRLPGLDQTIFRELTELERVFRQDNSQ